MISCEVDRSYPNANKPLRCHLHPVREEGEGRGNGGRWGGRCSEGEGCKVDGRKRGQAGGGGLGRVRAQQSTPKE